MCPAAPARAALVAELLRHGAYAGACNNAGASPLHYFALAGARDDPALFLEGLTLLTSRGADVNGQDKKGETPLHQAALCGLDEAVVILANLPAVELDLRDRAGETCLHFACKAGNLAAVQVLLARGADPSLAGAQGSCLDVARAHGHSQVEALLLERMQEDGRALDAADDGQEVGHIQYNPKLLEAVEMMGFEQAAAVACIFELQRRGVQADLPALLAALATQEPQGRECSVCLSSDVDALFLPCRHSAACLTCAEEVRQQTAVCPICREPIVEVLKIFLS